MPFTRLPHVHATTAPRRVQALEAQHDELREIQALLAAGANPVELVMSRQRLNDRVRDGALFSMGATLRDRRRLSPAEVEAARRTISSVARPAVAVSIVHDWLLKGSQIRDLPGAVEVAAETIEMRLEQARHLQTMVGGSKLRPMTPQTGRVQ